MSYRGDREADRARIDVLEAELERAQERIVDLEGARSKAIVKQEAGARALVARHRRSRLLGAPASLQLTRRWSAVLPSATFQELADLVQQHTQESGRVDLRPDTMKWTTARDPWSGGPTLVVEITVQDGVTTLHMTDQLVGRTAAPHTSVGVGTLGTSTAIVAASVFPPLAPVFFASWLGATVLLWRSLFKRSARRRAVGLQNCLTRWPQLSSRLADTASI